MADDISVLLKSLPQFMAFIVPGFIGLRWYELWRPPAPRDSYAHLIDIIAYSCIFFCLNYAALFFLILLTGNEPDAQKGVLKSLTDLQNPFDTAQHGMTLIYAWVAMPAIWVSVWIPIRVYVPKSLERVAGLIGGFIRYVRNRTTLP